MLLVNMLMVNLFAVLTLILILILIWFGCISTTKNNPAHSCLCAIVICLLFLYRLGARLVFIQINGGMEGESGVGSPLAFIFGMFVESVIFVPFLVLAIYGAVLWLKKSPTVA